MSATAAVPRSAATAACLAVLTILAVGAIVLSLETATPYGQARLKAAATATSNVSGFRVLVSAAPTTAGSLPPPTSGAKLQLVADLSYQAPDRILILTPGPQGGAELQVAVGTHAWISVDGGRTFATLRARKPGTSIGRQQADVILALPRRLALEDVPVHVQGDVLTFSTRRLDVLDAFGLESTGVPANDTVTDVRATVSAQGYLRDVAASVHFDKRSFVIIDEFSDLGNVTIRTPPPGSVTASGL